MPKNRAVIAEFHIRVFDDRTVQIDGPFKNFLLFRYAMNKAENAVLNTLAKESESQIITDVPTGAVIDFQKKGRTLQ